jgi:hypothetical protein
MDKRKPLLPLVRQLAAEKKFTSSVFVTQNPGEAVGFLVNASSTASARTADVRLGNAIAVG